MLTSLIKKIFILRLKKNIMNNYPLQKRISNSFAVMVCARFHKKKRYEITYKNEI